MATSLTNRLTPASTHDGGRAAIPRPAGERDAGPTLHRLAAMASLREWIRRSSPVLMHEAVLAGESPAEVAAAARLTVAEAHLTWNAWASRRLGAAPTADGLTLRDYLRVHTAFAHALSEATSIPW